MKTKTKVVLLILIPVVLSLVTITGLIWIQKEIKRAEQVGRLADEIVHKVFELDQVVSQNLLYPEERPQVQFRSLYDSLKKTLARFPTETAPEGLAIRKMIGNQEDIGFLFPLTIGGEGKQAADLGDRFYQEYKGQVTSQLLIKLREIVSDGFLLMKSSGDRINGNVQRANRLMITVILIGGLAMVLLAAFIGRTVLQSTKDLQREIDDRRRAEEDLRTSEQRFRLALRNAPVSVATQDLDLRYLWAYNQRTARPEEIIGKLDADIFTVEEAAHLAVIKRRVIEEDVECREQMWLDRPSGRIFLDVYFEPLHDANGRVAGVGSATVDLTPLKTSLREKEALLKEIHHRVKNNMQVISSLIALQADGLQDGALRAVLRDMTHRVRAMAMVHEKLYQSPDLARVEFAEYLRSLLRYLWRAHGTAAAGIRLVLDLEPVELPVHVAVPCGLILNELITNALKHAFQGLAGGEVAVSLRDEAPGPVVLRLRDNGAGLPAGFDWRQAPSLGLRLVEMLAGQLHAAVEVSGSGGTEFEISFVVQEQERMP